MGPNRERIPMNVATQTHTQHFWFRGTNGCDRIKGFKGLKYRYIFVMVIGIRSPNANAGSDQCCSGEGYLAM